ncbi:hypothetical protein BZA77DRAFT_352503 [Pyronema omphalodes]|nr:hypothetical protein BZA77DRAFT_352503 [Pyronema omphalodes]
MPQGKPPHLADRSHNNLPSAHTVIPDAQPPEHPLSAAPDSDSHQPTALTYQTDTDPSPQPQPTGQFPTTSPLLPISMSTQIEMQDLTPQPQPRNSFDIIIDIAAISAASIPSSDPPAYTERRGEVPRDNEYPRYTWIAAASGPIIMIGIVLIVYVVTKPAQVVKI